VVVVVFRKKSSLSIASIVMLLLLLRVSAFHKYGAWGTYKEKEKKTQRRVRNTVAFSKPTTTRKKETTKAS